MPSAAALAIRAAALALGCAAAAVPAATTMSITLAILSTVAAPPGVCLVSPHDGGGGEQAAALSVTVACSGSAPYVVAVEGAVADRLPGGSDPGRPRGTTFRLPAIAGLAAGASRAIMVQY